MKMSKRKYSGPEYSPYWPKRYGHLGRDHFANNRNYGFHGDNQRKHPQPFVQSLPNRYSNVRANNHVNNNVNNSESLEQVNNNVNNCESTPAPREQSNSENCVKNDENRGGVDEVKKECNECFSDPYLIILESDDTVISLLQNNLPELLKKLHENQKFKNCSCKMNIVCRNCMSGSMNDPCILIEHIRGKSHKKKVKVETGPVAKITLCRRCYKITFYSSTSDYSGYCELPQDLNAVVKQMCSCPSPDEGTKTVAENKTNEKNTKAAFAREIIFKNFKKSLSFSRIFEEITEYGKERYLDLDYICTVERPTDKISFCRFTRAHFRAEKLNVDNFEVDCCRITVELVKSFQDTLSDLLKNDRSKSVEWSVGTLTPPCEIFKDWNRLCSFIDYKLDEMAETAAVTQRLKSSIHFNLMKAIGRRWTVESVDFFGSRVTGLAFSNSDFDLQISTVEKCGVRDLARVLRPLFIIREVIPWAKVPIVRVLDERTGAKCDISLNNMNGVINSALLRFYLSLDERVKWLVGAVKTWASMNLINGSFAFTSYGLAWFVLFFLMQNDVNLVPAVQVLARLPLTSDRYILFSRETNTAFSLDMDQLLNVHNPRAKCKMNINELLRKFFDFCLSVCSSQDALNPYTGRICSRKEVAESPRTYDTEGNMSERYRIFKYSLIIIDPIKHSANITASVKHKMLVRFQNLCRQTLNYLT